MRKLGVLVLLWGALVWAAVAQPAGVAEISRLQDSLVRLGHVMYNEPGEPERLKANFTFVKTLVSALKTPHSYSFPFDSLNMVSILRSTDDRLRIFSWHIQLNDGSYLYYGTVQLRTPDGSLRLYPLLDKTFEIEKPEEAITDGSSWYGAQYYRLIPFHDDYLLLGWKGHTPSETQKVIEVLRLTAGGVQLGNTVFEGKDTGANARMIYRYNRNASMYMVYDSSQNRIILDHLVPMDANREGQYEHYGPDMTHDAWLVERGRLVFLPEIDIMNLPDANDERYNDPLDRRNHPKSGMQLP